MFKTAGAAYSGPTLWVYAAGDTFYRTDETKRALFNAYESGGGQGEFVFIADHTLTNAHNPPVGLWTPQADAFLKKLVK